MYLALKLLALLLFIAALLAALVFSMVWPVVLVALAIAVLAAGQIAIGARLLHVSLSIWFGSWGRSYQLLSAIWLATTGGDDDALPEAQRVPMALLPKLNAVLGELTAARPSSVRFSLPSMVPRLRCLSAGLRRAHHTGADPANRSLRWKEGLTAAPHSSVSSSLLPATPVTQCREQQEEAHPLPLGRESVAHQPDAMRGELTEVGAV